MSDGSSFSIDLGVQGAGPVASAADALAGFTSKLELAGAAATATSDAVKVGQAAYDQAEKSANKAALAVEKIGLAAQAQTGKAAAVAAEFGLFSPQFEKASQKLQQLTQRQTEAVAKSEAAKAAMNTEAAALDKLKSAASTAADVEAKLIKQQSAATKAAADHTKAEKEQADATTKSVGAAGLLEGAFAKLGGPLGAVGQKASGVAGAVFKMSKSIGAAGPYIAAAVLAIALAAAFVVATGAITKFAIGAADSARTSALLSDGIAGSVAGGRQLDKTFADLANKVPLTRDELSGMASDLAKTGLQGDALSTALEAAAVKAAKLKFGPDFKKELISLPNQAARLKANFNSLFSGLKIESLLEGLAKLVALFDANSESGKAIKVVFESMFQPIINGLTALVPKVVAAFLQVEIWALKALIAIKPYGGILEAIGIGFVVIGITVAAVAAIVLAAFAAMAAAFALLVALPFLVKSAFDYLGAGISSAIGGATDYITAKFQAVKDWLANLSLASLGTDLINGLIAGIMGAGPGVLNAITGIADGAIGAAKKALGIASPSKVFAEIGMHTAAGMEEGVDGGAPGVQAATQALVAPPDAPSANGGGASAAPAAGSGGLFAGAVFNFNGVGGDAKTFAEEFKDHVTDLLARAGGGTPHAA